VNNLIEQNYMKHF